MRKSTTIGAVPTAGSASGVFTAAITAAEEAVSDLAASSTMGISRFVILRLIAEAPRHGYEIIKEIEEKLGGAYSPSPGVVYPTLMLLEELGYANVTAGDGTKKLYAITPEGAAHLAANKETVDAIFGRIAEVGSAQGNGPAPQIVRAMENLHARTPAALGAGAADRAAKAGGCGSARCRRRRH